MRQKTIDAIMAHAALNIPVNVVVSWRKKAVLSVIFLAVIRLTNPLNILFCPRKTTPPPRTGER
jgi:hypothetical protein